MLMPSELSEPGVRVREHLAAALIGSIYTLFLVASGIILGCVFCPY